MSFVFTGFTSFMNELMIKNTNLSEYQLVSAFDNRVCVWL